MAEISQQLGDEDVVDLVDESEDEADEQGPSPSARKTDEDAVAREDALARTWPVEVDSDLAQAMQESQALWLQEQHKRARKLGCYVYDIDQGEVFDLRIKEKTFLSILGPICEFLSVEIGVLGTCSLALHENEGWRGRRHERWLALARNRGKNREKLHFDKYLLKNMDRVRQSLTPCWPQFSTASERVEISYDVLGVLSKSRVCWKPYVFALRKEVFDKFDPEHQIVYHFMESICEFLFNMFLEETASGEGHYRLEQSGLLHMLADVWPVYGNVPSEQLLCLASNASNSSYMVMKALEICCECAGFWSLSESQRFAFLQVPAYVKSRELVDEGANKTWLSRFWRLFLEQDSVLAEPRFAAEYRRVGGLLNPLLNLKADGLLSGAASEVTWVPRCISPDTLREMEAWIETHKFDTSERILESVTSAEDVQKLVGLHQAAAQLCFSHRPLPHVGIHVFNKLSTFLGLPRELVEPIFHQLCRVEMLTFRSSRFLTLVLEDADQLTAWLASQTYHPSAWCATMLEICTQRPRDACVQQAITRAMASKPPSLNPNWEFYFLRRQAGQLIATS